MRIKLIVDAYGDVSIPVSDSVLQELGWQYGDTLSLDIAMTGPYLIITKQDTKE